MGLSSNVGALVLQLRLGMDHRLLSQHVLDDRNDLLSDTRVA